jgi:competence protein ComEA
MPSTSPSRPQLAIYAAFAIAVLLIGARFLRTGGREEGAAASAPPALASTAAVGAPDGLAAAAGASAAAGAGGAVDGLGPRLLVDVKGAVRRPGVYRLVAGARAYDAVRRAGGLTGRADRIGVNLAARVVDGGEVVVPERAAGGGVATSGGAAGGSEEAGAGGATEGPLALDLNAASEQELEQLDGVGPAIAARIVAYREQHGGIASVDELDEVSGIGDAKLAAIRAQLGQ